MKTVKYGSRIKGRFYLILFIRLELDKILKSGNKATCTNNLKRTQIMIITTAILSSALIGVLNLDLSDQTETQIQSNLIQTADAALDGVHHEIVMDAVEMPDGMLCI